MVDEKQNEFTTVWAANTGTVTVVTSFQDPVVLGLTKGHAPESEPEIAIPLTKLQREKLVELLTDID